jgi:hypothetical protein
MTMKAKKIIKLAKKSEFVSAIKDQKSFIHRIKERYLKFRQLILDSFKRDKK